MDEFAKELSLMSLYAIPKKSAYVINPKGEKEMASPVNEEARQRISLSAKKFEETCLKKGAAMRIAQKNEKT